MPHLHLPADHSDADIVLAAHVAATVGSDQLFVAWTHDAGAAAPEICAVVRERETSLVGDILRAFFANVRAGWRSLFQSPAPVATTARVPASRAGSAS
jgi:hypothetical protein